MMDAFTLDVGMHRHFGRPAGRPLAVERESEGGRRRPRRTSQLRFPAVDRAGQRTTPSPRDERQMEELRRRSIIIIIIWVKVWMEDGVCGGGRVYKCKALSRNTKKKGHP